MCFLALTYMDQDRNQVSESSYYHSIWDGMYRQGSVLLEPKASESRTSEICKDVRYSRKPEKAKLRKKRRAAKDKHPRHNIKNRQAKKGIGEVVKGNEKNDMRVLGRGRKGK